MKIRLLFVFTTAGTLLTSAYAAPMLRLTNTAVGPISVAAGGSASGPLLEAYNAGDGSLSLTAQSSASWLSASIGGQTTCKTIPAPPASSCLPIQIQVNAGSMAASTTPYTGIITITAPNTIDAPQTITVTMAVGSAVPSSVNVYVAPGAEQGFLEEVLGFVAVTEGDLEQEPVQRPAVQPADRLDRVLAARPVAVPGPRQRGLGGGHGRRARPGRVVMVPLRGHARVLPGQRGSSASIDLAPEARHP